MVTTLQQRRRRPKESESQPRQRVRQTKPDKCSLAWAILQTEMKGPSALIWNNHVGRFGLLLPSHRQWWHTSAVDTQYPFG